MLIFLLVAYLGGNDLKCQQHIQIIQDTTGKISLYMKRKIAATSHELFQKNLSWINDHKKRLKGEVLYRNHSTGEIVLKGRQILSLGRVNSGLQTQMHFTLEIRQEHHECVASIKNIYYKSIPTYGKQGTPSQITYDSDWFHKNGYYRKNGKQRPLNTIYKERTIEAGKQLLTSLKARW